MESQLQEVLCKHTRRLVPRFKDFTEKKSFKQKFPAIELNLKIKVTRLIFLPLHVFLIPVEINTSYTQISMYILFIIWTFIWIWKTRAGSSQCIGIVFQLKKPHTFIWIYPIGSHAIDNRDNEVTHKWRIHFLCILVFFWFDLYRTLISEQHKLPPSCNPVTPWCFLPQAISTALFLSRGWSVQWK